MVPRRRRSGRTRYVCRVHPFFYASRTSREVVEPLEVVVRLRCGITAARPMASLRPGSYGNDSRRCARRSDAFLHHTSRGGLCASCWQVLVYAQSCRASISSGRRGGPGAKKPAWRVIGVGCAQRHRVYFFCLIFPSRHPALPQPHFALARSLYTSRYGLP